jgi:hypothetical protein
VNVPDAASLDLSGSWTASAWVNVTTLPANGTVVKTIAKDDGSANSNYALSLDNNDHCSGGVSWEVGFDTAGGSSYQSCYLTTINTGTWYLVTGTWNGTMLTLYVNGVSVATSTPGAVPTSSSGNPLELGNEAGNSFYVNGVIDDARVYNRALSAIEIRDLYDATSN